MDRLRGLLGRPLVPGQRAWLPAAVVLALVALDQASKAAVAGWLGRGRAEARWGLLEPLLALEYAENRGVAFGLLSGWGGLLAVLALAVLLGGTVAYLRAERPTVGVALAFGLIAGGALGNLLDRVRLGYVVDFVAVGAWPKFNVADAAITVGVLLLVRPLLLGEEPPPPGGRDPATLTDAQEDRPTAHLLAGTRAAAPGTEG